jgi:A/G-specific adenine glycosylase
MARERAPAIRRSLRRWYRRSARDLPWRRTHDPYAIWLSEIMLQQTRVETAIAYYRRFLDAFPTVGDLARARVDRVLKLWEGLGYYTRARHLHAAAKRIVTDHKGQFPETAAEWQALPGVGRYTAGAIASIAFDQRVPVLDGNVKRVLARLFHVTDAIDTSATIKKLWELAESLVPPGKPGEFNQALMELGATLCAPTRPQCAWCPLAGACEARRLGREAKVPVRRPKGPIPHYAIAAACIVRNGRYLMGKRAPRGLLGGLWEFPGGKVEDGETGQEAVAREAKEELAVNVTVGRHLACVDHAYSHFKVTIHLYACRIRGRGEPKSLYHSELKWIPRTGLHRYAFPAATNRLLGKLGAHGP